jgi:Flp pilus assembly protein TadD
MAPLPDDGLTAPADTVDQGIPEQAPNYIYDPGTAQDETSPAPKEQSQPKRPPSGTVVALLNQAREQQRSGKPERAAAVLERALRLDPRNAHLWHELARIRLQQGLLSQAESLAAKSTSLARDDESLVRSNETIIEQVKILRGGGL